MYSFYLTIKIYLPILSNWKLWSIYKKKNKKNQFWNFGGLWASRAHTAIYIWVDYFKVDHYNYIVSCKKIIFFFHLKLKHLVGCAFHHLLYGPIRFMLAHWRMWKCFGHHEFGANLLIDRLVKRIVFFQRYPV